jgi:hypothetical protein
VRRYRALRRLLIVLKVELIECAVIELFDGPLDVNRLFVVAAADQSQG